MKIYINDRLDPYFNLASEEYLMQNEDEEIFMLWRNERSVIIGANQNAYAELDLAYVEKNGIKVVRRLTGGGAVFHDPGNINFTFIVKNDGHTALDFERFTLPVIKALKGLGSNTVELSGRNDITVDGLKVSGNAQTTRFGKTLHHGTLLYDADMSELEGALRVDPEKIKSKGIKSVRSRVGNIRELFGIGFSSEEFLKYVENFISNEYSCSITPFSQAQIKAIEKLANEKYSTWEWNFGVSKEYGSKKKKRFPFGTVEVMTDTEHGIIKEVRVVGDFFGTEPVSLIENALVGKRYDKNEIAASLPDETVGKCIFGMTKADLIPLII